MDYNATITLSQRVSTLTEDATDEILDQFIDYAPALGAGPTGRAELVITVPAVGLQQAIRTVTALIANLPTVGLEVIPTVLWDEREAHGPLPLLCSVTEAAERLSVTRQAILQRIEAGSLPATRVGNGWGIPARALESARTRAERTPGISPSASGASGSRATVN